MKINYPTAVPIVLLHAVGLCVLPFAARACSHRCQPQLKAAQSNAHSDLIKCDIKVYLDGKEMSTESNMDSQSIPPIVVDGRLLISVRFVKEHLVKDVWVDRKWGIIQLQAGLLLKIGSKEWHAVPGDTGIDGLSFEVVNLPVAPREIRGRLYMPVDQGPFNYLQLPFKWDREKRELRFTHSDRRLYNM